MWLYSILSKASLTVKWLFSALPVFPTWGLIGQWCCQKSSTLDRSACSAGEDTLNKNNKQSATICTVTKDVQTSRPSSYIRPHYITPLVSKAWTPQRCGRDYSKESGISCQRSAVRRNNGAKPECDDTPTVTSRQYGRRVVLVSGDVRFPRWRHRWSKQTGGPLSSVFFFPSISALA